ncbi:MoxR family ATPase [Streptomyces sp. NBC_01275]|uniref:AAA family ATPase n=1 Tax=Streptomyces sp. NBC_01275 TaxID=2903807 RepID=UPI00225305F7|nr:MoxR family ATPase [Streptomyces sp. NBC_01275]MCX4763658.1 MoxR family ATPase [Streptomyces sp. NBC_01275]
MTRFVSHGPDPRDGRIYDLSQELRLAIDVALATDRPLLLSGEPGSGKSSLAPFYARDKHLRYYEHVVTSRTQATDLLWTFDSVRRLGDAQVHRDRLNDGVYVNPGVLWWSLAPESARTRGGLLKDVHRHQPDPLDRFQQEYWTRRAVVLIDEIDKADPDVPNSLLVPLGSQEFTIAETGTPVRRESGVDAPLIVITTNGERQLPQAFLRRCVTFTLPAPTRESLVRIAGLHLEHAGVPLDEQTLALVGALADELIDVRENGRLGRERAPSTAEYLDALRACRALGVRPGDPQWLLVRNLTLVKSPQQEG